MTIDDAYVAMDTQQDTQQRTRLAVFTSDHLATMVYKQTAHAGALLHRLEIP